MLLQVEFYSITRPGCDTTAKQTLILRPNRQVKQQRVATTGQSSGSRKAMRPRDAI
jgi:hypothetical protein